MSATQTQLHIEFVDSRSSLSNRVAAIVPTVRFDPCFSHMIGAARKAGSFTVREGQEGLFDTAQLIAAEQASGFEIIESTTIRDKHHQATTYTMRVVSRGSMFDGQHPISLQFSVYDSGNIAPDSVICWVGR